jgi:uncharacterized protein YbaR (Trm112 family)/SAM-dependent methyltransferase
MTGTLTDLLVCPACQGRLRWSNDQARCETCTSAYPVSDGIPVLLVDQSAAEHDELDHMDSHGHDQPSHDHKQRQTAYFDRHEAAEFEITRPHGAPALYTWLMRQKFRRSLAGLNGTLAGATALTVCGGSGMDGEFLARAGARVIVSDLSLGAAQRAQERAGRYGLPMLAIVADVERLPFADRAMDLVYVHDGLHHIEQPQAGLAEMTRVANRAVSITEPAQAVATQLAVRAGWATNVEEAGNRVARLTIAETTSALRTHGLRVTHVERYAMYYRHQPGAIAQRLSHPALFPLARATWLAGNGVIGRIGNKLTIQAVRPA